MFDPFNAKSQVNGADIMDRRLVGDTWVWLCDRPGAYQPYVTWISPKHDPGATCSGNYFSRLAPACKNFYERILKLC